MFFIDIKLHKTRLPDKRSLMDFILQYKKGAVIRGLQSPFYILLLHSNSFLI